jgi:hypothetical protein
MAKLTDTYLQLLVVNVPKKVPNSWNQTEFTALLTIVHQHKSLFLKD